VFAAPFWVEEFVPWMVFFTVSIGLVSAVWTGVYRLHKSLLATIERVVTDNVQKITDKLSEIEKRHQDHYEDHEVRIEHLERRRRA
jgi:hypothetical protein